MFVCRCECVLGFNLRTGSSVFAWIRIGCSNVPEPERLNQDPFNIRPDTKIRLCVYMSVFVHVFWCVSLFTVVLICIYCVCVLLCDFACVPVCVFFCECVSAKIVCQRLCV